MCSTRQTTRRPPVRSATSRSCCCPGTSRPTGSAPTRTSRSAGDVRELAIAARALGTELPVRLWTPPGTADDEPLPLLAVHDGPEYDELAGLTSYLGAMAARGALPRVRAALLSPGPRDDWYSANGAYTRALCLAVLPNLRSQVTTTAVVGMGASLGALAMLHAQRRHSGTFDALFLQSGSFFHPRFDAHERRFPHYDRIERSVDGVLRAGRASRAGAGRDDLRADRGEHREQPHDGARARGAGVRRGAARAAGRAQLHRLAGRVRPLLDPAAADGGVMKHVELTSPTSGWRGSVVVHGHWGRPVLVFPSEGGSAWDFESNGMVDEVRWLVDAGRVKFYCVDSADAATWSDRSVPLEERARRHDQFEQWVLQQVVPWMSEDSGGATDFVTLGCSLGAYHAANIALRHADLFPLALCFSGNYDPAQWHAWGERGDAAYFHNPVEYVANLSGGHLDWLRSRINLVLVVGQGAWEVDPTGSLPGTHRLAQVLADKGIPHELDVWGHDVPHDWPSWRRQLAHHLPRFC